MHDKKLEFHEWLLSHDLTMPKCLATNRWEYIHYFCKPAGIEYLNKKFSACSQDEFEKRLERILESGHVKFLTDFEETLSDYLEKNKTVTDNPSTLWNQKESKGLDYQQLDSAFSSFLRTFIK